MRWSGQETVGSGRHGDGDAQAAVRLEFAATGLDAEVAVADVERAAAALDVAQPHKEVGIVERRADIQFGVHVADDFDVAGQGGVV